MARDRHPYKLTVHSLNMNKLFQHRSSSSTSRRSGAPPELEVGQHLTGRCSNRSHPPTCGEVVMPEVMATPASRSCPRKVCIMRPSARVLPAIPQ